MISEIKDSITDYYDNKLKQFGTSAKGVDWNGKDSQYVRFNQLTKVLDYSTEKRVEIADLGCGYGELIKFMNSQNRQFGYVGYDISAEMITSAKRKFPDHTFRRIDGYHQISEVDFIVASGVFNVKLKCSDAKWLDYIKQSLSEIYQKCRLGISLNFLTSYSDSELMREYLYYTDPNKIFDWCKGNLSKNVALLHDYDLYEFTIMIKK